MTVFLVNPCLTDLALSSGSFYHHGLAGCDGADTGANISLAQTYTAGVP